VLPIALGVDSEKKTICIRNATDGAHNLSKYGGNAQGCYLSATTLALEHPELPSGRYYLVYAIDNPSETAIICTYKQPDEV
jgi:hypothetical protein